MRSSPADPAQATGRREAALRFLQARTDHERSPEPVYSPASFDLERMRELLDRLGNPQRSFPAVHIAGTKGKGSTAVMIAQACSAAGYRTGLTTSPHLERVEERIMVDGQPCSADEFAALVEDVAPAVQATDEKQGGARDPKSGLTYFEIVTAMAMLFFARRQVDLAVLEVGLGGRLDATNVCCPQVSVITSISFDHTRELGNTLAQIAREKAGIVKPAVPVVSGVTQDEPRGVIRRVCEQLGCRLVELLHDFDFRYAPPQSLETVPAKGKLDFFHRHPGTPRELRDITLGLLGRHQAANAAVALATLGELNRQGWRIAEGPIRSALTHVVWPGRVELMARRPAIVVDGAHNVASVAALLETLNESFSGRPRWLIFAASRGKDVDGMLAKLLAQFDQVIFTRYLSNPRSVPPEELAARALAVSGRRCHACRTPTEAWDVVRAAAHPEELICAGGSLFLAAEMRCEIQTRPYRARA